VRKTAATRRQVPDVATLRDLAAKWGSDQDLGIARYMAAAWIIPEPFEWPDCCEPYKAIFRPTEGRPQLVLVHNVGCQRGGDRYISARAAQVVKLVKFRY